MSLFDNVLSNINVKRPSEVLQELVDYTTANTTEINDFSVGSVIRSIYEAISLELESFYTLSAENAVWAIEHGVMDAFGFSPREASPAYGDITVNFYMPLAKPTTLFSGTSFYGTSGGSDITFSLNQDTVIPAGNISATLTVYADIAGTIGNVSAHSINRLSSNVSNISSVDNNNAFMTGYDEETLDSVRQRFNEFVETRGRGTLKAMDYAARSVPGIFGVYVYEVPGMVTVYCHDANGNLSQDLASKVALAEEDYRPVGMPWEVAPVVKKTVDLTVNLTVTDIKTVDSRLAINLQAFVDRYISQMAVGQDLVMSDLISKVKNYSPYIYDVSISPATNVTQNPNEILRTGTIDVEIAGVNV